MANPGFSAYDLWKTTEPAYWDERDEHCHECGEYVEDCSCGDDDDAWDDGWFEPAPVYAYEGDES